MKLTKILVSLLPALAFIGCASTESTSVAPQEAIDSQPETEETKAKDSGKGATTLIESYISGEIPGYK